VSKHPRELLAHGEQRRLRPWAKHPMVEKLIAVGPPTVERHEKRGVRLRGAVRELLARIGGIMVCRPPITDPTSK
jgi:hypothetical protein